MKQMILLFLILIPWLSRAQVIDSTSQCSAYFKYELNTPIRSLVPSTAINFLDYSNGDIVSWSWDFGNGQVSYEQNPTMIFVHPLNADSTEGNFSSYVTVKLTILTSDSCSSSYSTTIDIYDPLGNNEPNPPLPAKCMARFKYYMTSFDSISGLATFQFNDRSEGQNLTYAWQFDDSTVSSEAEPIKSFDLSQVERTVCLTIDNGDGCVDQFCDSVWVSSPHYPDIEPIDTTYNDCFVSYGYKVDTIVSTLLPALFVDFYPRTDDDVVKILWDFGDGSTSSEKYPTHTFEIPSIQDSLNGASLFRTVCITITTASGCESYYCDSIYLYSSFLPDSSDCSSYFNYRIAYDVITSPEVRPYRFSFESNAEVASLYWEFEDGTISTEKEPLVMFDIFKPTQKVCLSTTSVDGCISDYCNVVYVSGVSDSMSVEPACNYFVDIKGEYPIWASACVGTASAQLFTLDSVAVEGEFLWSNGVEGSDVEGLCPTVKYSVVAYTPDDCKVISTFIFNSDGSISVQPNHWWIDGKTDDSYVYYEKSDNSYSVYWVLCDGAMVEADSVSIAQINCENSEANLIVKDTLGNVVYSESVALRTTDIHVLPMDDRMNVTLYPNPVNDILSVGFDGNPNGVLTFEVYDLSGRLVYKQSLGKLSAGSIASVDLTSLKQGVYLGKVLSGQNIITVKKFNK